MSLGGAIESILKHCLGPFVEDLDVSHLHTSILRGGVKLNNIKFKKDLLSLCGLEGFQLNNSQIGSIQVHIPWNSVFTGKTSVVIEGVNANVLHTGIEDDEKLLESIRDGRHQALAARVEQLRALAQQRKAAQAYVEEKKNEENGFLANMIYKFVNNLTLKVDGVGLSFKTPNFGVGLQAGVGEVAVLSADPTFTQTSDKHSINNHGSDVHKLLRVTGLFAQMTTLANAGREDETAYVLTPCSMSIKLSHQPSKELMKVQLEFGTDRDNEVVVSHKQLSRLVSAQAAIAQEQAYSQNLLAPKIVAKPILRNEEKSKEEYGQLYYKKVLKRFMTDEEQERLRVLEDVLPLQILAAQRTVAEEAADELFSRYKITGIMGRMSSVVSWATFGCVAPPEPKLPENLDQSSLSLDTTLAQSFEHMDAPQNIEINVQSGRLVARVIDDRFASDVPKHQLLEANLLGTRASVFVKLGEDYKGNSSADLNVECVVRQINAQHAGQKFICLSEDYIKMKNEGSMGAAASFSDDDDLIRFNMTSSLEVDHNLLRVKLRALPLDIHFPPSLLQQGMDFGNSLGGEELPRQTSTGSQRSNGSDTPSAGRTSGFGDDSALAGDTAAQWVDEFAKRAPDRIALDIALMAGLVHVPMEGVGSAMLNLGNLTVSTPGPCALTDFHLAVNLSDTCMRTISHVGEVFEVLQPMKLGLELYQHQDDGEEGTVTIAIETQIGKAAFAMGPHQLQIIMSVVAALTPPTSVVPEMPDDYWYDMEQQAITEALQGSDMAAKLEAFAKRRVQVNVDVRAEALSVDLWDYSIPFLRLQSQLVDGVSFKSDGLASGEEQRVNVVVPEIKLDLTALNSRNGAWEPLLEELSLSVAVESVPSSVEGSLESATVTNVICNSSTGLLVNVVPTSLQRLVQLVPKVVSCLEPVQEKKGESTGTTNKSHVWTKYRAVNLTDMVMHVEVDSEDSLHQVRIEPTGSDWIALDELLVVGDARALTVRLENGNRSSPLRLERCGAVTVPGTRFIAELMSHREGHRVLLLAPAMRLHNTTDIPLLLRFFNYRGEESGAIPKSSMICNGNVIGQYAPEYKTVSQYTQKDAPPTMSTSQEGLMLPPNCVCAVPPQLLLEGKHSVQLSLKPAIKGASFCEMQSLGLHEKSTVVSCSRVMLDAPLAPVAVTRRRGGACICFGGQASEPFGAEDSQGEMMHFRVDVVERSNPLPEPTEPTAFTTLVLRPTLTLLNAVPIKNLIVECANGEGMARWYPATIPKMTGHNFYCSSSSRVSLRAKLAEEGAWSKMLNIRLDAPATSASSQTLELSAVRGEGSAGGLMEIIGPAQARICCPLWFVERAGLSSLGTLKLTNEDAILPSADGLSLLPADCFDDPIEMTLHTEHSGQMRQRMKMPPSHDTFSWKSSAGRLNMCLQTEDIAPAGVLGARCKVLILRPRMMVTNSSSKDLELCIFGPGEKKPATLLGSFSAVAAASRGLSNNLLSRDSSKKEEEEEQTGGAAAAASSSSEEQGEAKRNWSMKRILDGIPLARNSESQQKKSSSTSETSWHLQEGQVLILPAGTSKELHFDPEQSGLDAKALAAMVGFRERGQEAWAGPVLCSEETIGRRAWAVQRTSSNGANTTDHRKSHTGPSVYDVAVAASRGGLSVTFDSGAELIAANRIVKSAPSMVVKPWAKPGSECEFTVPLKRKVPIGWPQPALDDNAWKVDVVIEGKSYTIQDVRQAKRSPVVLEDGRSLELSLARHGSNILMTLEEASILAAKQDSVLNLSLAIPRIGVSVISEEGSAASELLFLAVDGVAVQYALNSSTDTENLRLAIADLQLDCQLHTRVEGVGDGQDRPGNPKQFATRRRQAVLLCKKEGEDEVDFVSLQWQREAASSQDMLFSMLNVALPKIEIVFDDEWFNPLLDVILSIGGDAAQDLGFSYETITKEAGKPLAQGYTPPALPSVLQVEGFQLSAVDLTVSASLPFESFDFLPKYARKILQVLCISRHFSLNHAHIRLPSKEIPASRGSPEDFGIGLAHEYTFSLIMNVATVLGKSSLLNLPAAPIKLGGAAVALVTDRISGATGEVATKLSALAMDSRYMQRRQERKEQRQINHAGEGVFEAGKSLADGVKGVFDIVRKPIEGAREGGCGGFARGIGEGVAGTVVKPIVGVGSAISDLGSGIAATAAAGPRLRLRRGDQHTRTRMPRLLFGELGEVRFYSTVEAALLQEYGAEFTHAVSEVVPLVNESLRSVILMLFRERAILVEVQAHNDLSLHSESEKKKKSGEKKKTLLQQHFGHAFTPIPRMQERAREFKFTQLNRAQLDYKDHHKFALLIDDKHGHKHELLVHDQIVSEKALLALCEGLETASKDPRHRANWRPLRRELNDAKLASALDAAYATTNEVTEEHTLRVVEVLRRSQEKNWSVPFLPTDWGLSWRWVDMRGQRHSYLDSDRSQKEIVEWSRPPCDMDTRRFKATSDWEVSVQEGTDNEGWTYAPTWGTTEWHKEAVESDCLRRRVWQKQYKRRSHTSSSKVA